MKKFSYMLLALAVVTTTIVTPFKQVNAAVQTSITRSEAEQRALNMINLSWTYSKIKNSNLSNNYLQFVTQPTQFNNVTTAQVTGIPYDWGGSDSLNSCSYNAPWTSFLDAINNNAYAGNVNTEAGYGYIPGTAGIDCSGFVQASFNIAGSKLSTSTLLNNYFTKINLSDIKHMDILDKPGDHVVIFDKWGSLNGVSGAFTYESTPDQTYGGIQGTKQYFMTMNELNSGYIPGRYVNIIEENQTPAPTPTPIQTTPTISSNGFGQVSNVSYYANFRLAPSTSGSLLGTLPKGTILHLDEYSSGWYKTSYKGQVGYVYGNLVSAIPSNKYVAINNVSMLNIRSLPSTAGSILGVISTNEYAEVIGSSTDGNWYKIKVNGIEGWSAKNYLKYIY